MANPTLNDYLTDVRDLLHDPADVYWSSPQKTRYINRAREQRDRDTANNRTVLTLTLTVGQELYSLTDLGDTTVFDVIGIALRYNGTRILLYQRSFTELTAEWRAFISSQWTPWAMTRYNSSTFYLSPKPATAYVTEWDCARISAALSGGTDTDTMGGPFANPVAFYAAYLAKYNERQYAEGQAFLNDYYREIKGCQGARAGMLPSAYSSYGR